MGWFGSKDDAAAWREREDELQDKAQQSLDDYGQDDPRARAAYADLAEHNENRRPGFWGWS